MASRGVPKDEAGALLNAARRQTVPNACNRCRECKVKCDGQRPSCRRCRQRNVQCIFAGFESETPRQTLQRRFDEYSRLFDELRNGDERGAMQILHEIREGDAIETILARFPSYGTEQRQREQNRLRRLFLLTLVQSTADLRDMVRLASMVLLNPDLTTRFPEATAYEPLRNCVVRVEKLAGILVEANPSSQHLLSLNIEPPYAIQGFSDNLPFWVTASPWTTVTVSDEVVSHLVSTFLVLANGFWRFVEQDVFLRAMRAGKSSQCCSPLLVNAILAYASLFSENPEVFLFPGEMLTRGEHFHREALKQWSLDPGESSICTIQALFVLAIDCTIRGKDKQGLELKNRALELHKTLGSEVRLSEQMHSPREAKRVMKCLEWTCEWMDVGYAFGLLLPFEAITTCLDDGLEDFDELLPDTVEYWSAYPLLPEPFPLRTNILFQQRRKLTSFIATLMEQLFSRDTSHRPVSMDRLSAFSQAILNWHQNLPRTLEYRSRMPVNLFEFHAQCLSVQMTLSKRALELSEESDGSQSSVQDASNRAAFEESSLSFAHETSRLLQDFREMYGYKISTITIVHSATLAATILVQKLKNFQDGIPQAFEGIPNPSTPSRDAVERVETSFEECFRCLLAMGMHSLLARAIARLIYRGSRQLGVRLPSNAEEMLRIVSQTSWQATDLHRLDSRYPSWLMQKISSEGEGPDRMPHWLRRWEEMEEEDAARAS